MYKLTIINEGLRTVKNKIEKFVFSNIIIISLAIATVFFLAVSIKQTAENKIATNLKQIQQRKIDSLEHLQNVQYFEKINIKSFTEKNLIEYLNRLNIKYIDVVLSQAKVESGNFSSYLFRVNNNLFGMKVAEKRPTTTIGVHRRHAVYNNWQQSVLDYAMLQSTILPKVKSKKQYVAYLDKYYSELPKGEYEKLINKNIE